MIQAQAQYRSTVISAFQNVADTLHALVSDAAALSAAVEAEQAAKVTLDLTVRQSKVGYVNYLTLLSAQQAYQTALMSARAGRGDPLRRHGGALPGAGWRMVAPRPAANRIPVGGGCRRALKRIGPAHGRP